MLTEESETWSRNTC